METNKECKRCSDNKAHNWGLLDSGLCMCDCHIKTKETNPPVSEGLEINPNLLLGLELKIWEVCGNGGDMPLERVKKIRQLLATREADLREEIAVEVENLMRKYHNVTIYKTALDTVLKIIRGEGE